MTERPPIHDPLEAELEAMRPAEPSKELFDAVGRSLAAPRVGPSRLLRIGSLGAALAACVLVAVGIWKRGPTVPTPSIAVTNVPSPAAGDEDRPALGHYRRALAHSPASLDDLLDRHAARPLAGPRQAAGVGGGLLDFTLEH